MNLRLRSLVIALLGLTTSLSLGRMPQSSPSALDSGKPCVVPFTLVRHLIVVDVQIGKGDKTYKFLFDTGMNLTIVDNAVIADLNLKKLQEVPATDSSGSEGKMGIFTLDSVRLSKSKVDNVIIGGVDLKPLGRQAGIAIDGILGDNFMRSFCVKVDYRKKLLTLSLGEAAVKGGISLKAPKRALFSPIAVPFMLDGKPLMGIIDTGAHDIGLPAAVLEKLEYPPTERLKAKGAMTGGLMGSGGQDILVRAGDLKIGSQSLKRYPTFSVKNDKALIGYRFLSQFVVTIDYPRETVYLEPYKDAKFADNSFHTGMALSKNEKGEVVVTGLWEGGPADQLGIAVGDVVDKIGEKNAADYSQFELSGLASDPEIKELVLEIRHGLRSKTVKLVKANLFPS